MNTAAWWQRRVALLTLALILAIPMTGALAQQRDIRVEVGFAGEVVADSWNPLRVRMRDQPSAELILEIDRGSLREGEQLVVYRAPLEAGSGLYLFEDDLFIPAWRRFSWTVRTDNVVLASGTLDRRSVNPAPLTLVVSDTVGAERGRFDQNARVVDAPPAALPERLAAFAGVEVVLVASGTTPRAAALAAAASSGARVVLLEPLANDPALRALVSAPRQRLGAGWLVRTPEDALAASLSELATLEQDSLGIALVDASLTRAPPPTPIVTLTIAVGGYLLLVALTLRFGGTPGLLAALSLALIASLAAWSSLRPNEATLVRGRSLYLGAGGLATGLEVRTLYNLPAQRYTLNSSGYPRDLSRWQVGPDGLSLELARWQAATLIMRPTLQSAQLRVQGERLENHGEQPLGEVFVIGVGPQPSLAGGATLSVRSGQGHADYLAPPLYEPLLAHLPVGSALARRGGQIHVALPETASQVAPTTQPTSQPTNQPTNQPTGGP